MSTFEINKGFSLQLRSTTRTWLRDLIPIVIDKKKIFIKSFLKNQKRKSPKFKNVQKQSNMPGQDVYNMKLNLE